MHYLLFLWHPQIFYFRIDYSSGSLSYREKNIRLSVPPIWIYTPLDAQLSTLLFSIFKRVCWYEKLVFILVCLRAQNWRGAMLYTHNWTLSSWTVLWINHQCIHLLLLMNRYMTLLEPYPLQKYINIVGSKFWMVRIQTQSI